MTPANPTPEQPADFGALVAWAQREHRAGRLNEAVAAFRQVLAIRPDLDDAHNELGIILAKLRQFDQAAARFAQAIALRPGNAEAHNNLGNVLLSQGKLAAAAAQYEQAIDLRPDHAETYNTLGSILWRQRKLDQAAARFEQALALRPDHGAAHCNLGSVLWKQGKLDLAAARYEQALALQPDLVEVHNNLGAVLRSQGKLDRAKAHLEQALSLKPDYASAHNNLGNVLSVQGEFDAAAAHYERAIALRPNFADARLGLAACHLVSGDYERGWPAYEARLGMPGLVPPPNLTRWTGQSLAGRSLLLLAEQGFGDTFHFIRYARLLKQQGARVVLACPRALGQLLATHPDLDELFILGSSDKFPQCDFYLPLLSAPGAFCTNAFTIPAEVPYLWADPELTDKWRQELAAIDGFKIGIVWQGSRDFDSDRWRSVPLAQFAPLANVPGVRLISLQKGFGSEQVAAVDFPVLDLSVRLDDGAGPFMDTAAVIAGLDLVVTANTAIAHLAGALGAPVWVALPFGADWRWLLDRDDSPWYPTMRLFRQTTFDGWADVFRRIAKAAGARNAAGGTTSVGRPEETGQM